MLWDPSNLLRVAISSSLPLRLFKVVEYELGNVSVYLIVYFVDFPYKLKALGGPGPMAL